MSFYNVKTFKSLKFYLKTDRKMIKQEAEQLKVDKLNITKCLRRTTTNAQELSNSFHTDGTIGSFFQKTTCKCAKKLSKSFNISISP